MRLRPALEIGGYALFEAGGGNSEHRIEYLVVRYGGGVPISPLGDAELAPALMLFYWWTSGMPGKVFELRHVSVERSADVGLYAYTGGPNVVTISNSAFIWNGRYGVYGSETSEGRLIVSDSWWGDPSGPYHETANPDGRGDAFLRAEVPSWLAEPLLLAPPQDEPSYEECCSSVLFLPGIKGSRLYMASAAGEEKLWEPSLTTRDGPIRELFLGADGASVNEVYVKKRDVLNSAAGRDYYASFIADMNALASENVIAGFEPAAYDWRLSLDDIVGRGYEESGKIFYTRATSTPYLEQTLRSLAASSKTGKVVVVAHSNGGLVAKKLMGRLGADAARLIDDVIFVGVPQSGAPQALGALLYGHGEGIPDFFPVVVGKDTARKLGENSPMAYHLLPSQAYFDAVLDIAHPVGVFSGEGYSREREAYGFLLNNWNELARFLVAEEGGRDKPAESDIARPNVLNPALVEYAKRTHDELDAWVPPEGIVVHQVAGWGIDTIAGIEFFTLPNASQTAGPTHVPKRAYRPVFVEDGDGVVPAPSALLMSTSTENVKRWWFDLDKYKEQNPKRDHADILEIVDVRKFIGSLVKEDQSFPTTILTSQPTTNRISKKLRFFLHSPLSLTVLDADGNTVGEYDEFGDVKYVTVPAGPTYALKLAGYDSGTFTLEMQEISGGSVVASSTIANVPSTASTTAKLTIGATLDTISTLAVDTDGDGIDDVTMAVQAGETVVYESPKETSSSEAAASGEPSSAAPSSGVGGSIWSAPAPAASTTKVSIADSGTATSSAPVSSGDSNAGHDAGIPRSNPVRTSLQSREITSSGHHVEDKREIVTQTAAAAQALSQQSRLSKTFKAVYAWMREAVFTFLFVFMQDVWKRW